jgi:hypothetical protein
LREFQEQSQIFQLASLVNEQWMPYLVNEQTYWVSRLVLVVVKATHNQPKGEVLIMSHILTERAGH